MKKLLALFVVGGLLALTTGCPPGTTSAPETPRPPKNPDSGGTNNPPKKSEVKGTAKSAAKDKVTVTDADKKDWDLTVTGDTKVTIDGKDGKAEDIKKDSTITATKDGDKVTKIDATSPTAVVIPPTTSTTVKGKAKSAAKDKVTVTGDDGKDVDLAVTGDTKVTIDGKDGKAEDIKKDSTITATKDGDKVTKIDATSAAAPPPPPPPPPPPAETTAKGTVKSAAKDKIVITDSDKKDWDLTVTGDTKVTIDGKDGKAEDIKKGSDVTATKKGDTVTKIDATSPK